MSVCLSMPMSHFSPLCFSISRLSLVVLTFSFLVSFFSFFVTSYTYFQIIYIQLCPVSCVDHQFNLCVDPAKYSDF